MRAHHPGRQVAGGDLLDHEGSRDIQEVGHLDRCELLLRRHQRGGPALTHGAQQLADELQGGGGHFDGRLFARVGDQREPEGSSRHQTTS